MIKATLIQMSVHFLIALGLNTLAKHLGIVYNIEVLTVYFILLAFFAKLKINQTISATYLYLTQLAEQIKKESKNERKENTNTL